MAKYGDLFVDDKYSAIVEPNLYKDTVLIPGVTFTEKYVTGPAGQIMVHKLINSGVEVGTPGRDFTDEAVQDQLITISFNNNFQKSTKIYGVQVNAVAFPVAEEALSDGVKAVRETRQDSGLACLVEEGTETTVTGSTAEEKLLSARKAVRDNKGKADFALVSTAIYAELLKNVGIQTFADEAVRSGELLRRYGLNIIETQFTEEEAKYYDNTGALKTVDLTGVEMIVGNHEAFSLLDNVDMFRLIDSENFNGSKAQVEINSGMTVNSPEQIAVVKA